MVRFDMASSTITRDHCGTSLVFLCCFGAGWPAAFPVAQSRRTAATEHASAIAQSIIISSPYLSPASAVLATRTAATSEKYKRVMAISPWISIAGGAGSGSIGPGSIGLGKQGSNRRSHYPPASSASANRSSMVPEASQVIGPRSAAGPDGRAQATVQSGVALVSAASFVVFT